MGENLKMNSASNTSMAVLKVCALTEQVSHTPRVFMSVISPVSPLTPQVVLLSTACFACKIQLNSIQFVSQGALVSW